ncbi:MAG TPA: hypothetical protein VMB18_19355 [Terriglobales bacterium]|nr:hypothetical protein [Terriglobales bacterium]
MDTTAAAAAPAHDDALTICAISILAFILADVLHEAVGHALLALLTGAQSGVLSTTAWSSSFDSRLVAAGGTLVNLAAGLIFWIALRSANNAGIATRLFLLLTCAFNLFTGTGYFFFSGVTDFGDWAAVIAPMHPHWLWRTLLIFVGMGAYYGAVLAVGYGVVRYTGVAANDRTRLRKLLFLPYFSAIAIAIAGGLLNPVGFSLVWQSALPATAGANSGLLWLQYYIPSRTTPQGPPLALNRNYAWIAVAVICSFLFVALLGPGIALRR